MTWDKIRSVCIGLLCFVAFFGLIVGGCTLANNSDADADCYTNFRNTYTWNFRTPEMNAIWADHKITNAECSKVQEIYKGAQVQAVVDGQR